MSTRKAYRGKAMKAADDGPSTLEELFEWSMRLRPDVAVGAVRIALIDILGEMVGPSDDAPHASIARGLLTLEFAVHRAHRLDLPTHLRDFVDAQRVRRNPDRRPILTQAPTQEATE